MVTIHPPPIFMMLPIDEIRPHPDNPRRGNIAAIRESIRQHGMYTTVLVQASSRYIIAGRHRWEAARLEGKRDIPCLVWDVDDDTAKRVMLVDNRTTDLATYDPEQLVTLLARLDDAGGLQGTGYTDDDLQALIEALDAPGGHPDAPGHDRVDVQFTARARGMDPPKGIRERQLTLGYPAGEYERLVAILDDVREDQGMGSYAEAVQWLCSDYRARRDDGPRYGGRTA